MFRQVKNPSFFQKPQESLQTKIPVRKAHIHKVSKQANRNYSQKDKQIIPMNSRTPNLTLKKTPRKAQHSYSAHKSSNIADPSLRIELKSLVSKVGFNEKFKKLFSQRLYSVNYGKKETLDLKINRRQSKDKAQRTKIPRKNIRSHSLGQLDKVFDRCAKLQSRNKQIIQRLRSGLECDLDDIKQRYDQSLRLFSKKYVSDSVLEFIEQSQGFLYGRRNLRTITVPRNLPQHHNQDRLYPNFYEQSIIYQIFSNLSPTKICVAGKLPIIIFNTKAEILYSIQKEFSIPCKYNPFLVEHYCVLLELSRHIGSKCKLQTIIFQDAFKVFHQYQYIGSNPQAIQDQLCIQINELKLKILKV